MAKPHPKAVATEQEGLPVSAARPKRRRLTRDERRAAILSEAEALFADSGFGASTRALAARLGLTQAALYKHFPSKQDIISALLEERASHWLTEDWHGALTSSDAPLAERLGRLYAGYLAAITSRSMRLFVRAGLEGYGQPARRGAMLTASILEPVISALRTAAGLPDLSSRPMRHEEREIAMALHGALMFLAIRKHVYRMALADDLSELAMRQVRLWLPGAVAELRDFHAGPPEQTVPQLSPRRKQRATSRRDPSDTSNR